MKETRHPHPHLDPRQPRPGAVVGTNPPVFVWKAPSEWAPFSLRVWRDDKRSDVVLQRDQLMDPMWLPQEALAPGTYTWAWSCDRGMADVLSFVVPEAAVTLEVPEVRTWLTRFGEEHPRIYVTPADVAALRQLPTDAVRQTLLCDAEAILNQDHTIAEPDCLPDRRRDYKAFLEAFRSTMWDSRAFVAGAQTMALAHLLTGRRDVARAACERMASICRWDPEGSSFLGHNDEAHMSVIWNGPATCDWVWHEFTEEERALVIEQFRARGRLTYDHMHGRGIYGVTRFDSHAGREIVFLAMLSMVFHDHIPEAEEWLEWLRPVLCGIWPVWAGEDGAWAEGISYGLAYVSIMQMFATALKRGAGVNLYRRPFWRGQAEWRRWCFPPYAEWIGFGDHSERWRRTWESSADLVDIIARETPAPEFADFAAEIRREALRCPQRPGVQSNAWANPQCILFPPVEGAAGRKTASSQVLRVFHDAGWAAVRTAMQDPASDIAMIFRSSPFGSISHSHANNNDFILHVGGHVMAMPSGYYAGYGSPHHANWVWHTKSHNCLTLSDAGQIMRSHDSVGSVDAPFEDAHIAYFRGTADASYADRAERCRRHVLYLKQARAFLMVDEFVARDGIVSAPQWNLHGWAPFEVDEERRAFSTAREGCALHGQAMYHFNSFFVLSEGWDPPPTENARLPEWTNQYHLRFHPAGLFTQLNLGVILSVDAPGIDRASVNAGQVGSLEQASVGAARILLNTQGIGIQHDDGADPCALALVRLPGADYVLTEGGIANR